MDEKMEATYQNYMGAIIRIQSARSRSVRWGILENKCNLAKFLQRNVGLYDMRLL